MRKEPAAYPYNTPPSPLPTVFSADYVVKLHTELRDTARVLADLQSWVDSFREQLARAVAFDNADLERQLLEQFINADRTHPRNPVVDAAIDKLRSRG